MVFDRKKKKEETSKEHISLENLILKELEEGKFDDRTFPTTFPRSYSNLVDGISSLGYSREEVEEKISEMRYGGLVEVWNISGNYSIIVKAGESSAAFAIMNSDGGM